jgi:predicted GIY-YIG superfamily endonuclease
MVRKLTYDFCKGVAKKCKTRKQLRKLDVSVMNKILDKKWYELLEHMERRGNKYLRGNYIVVFPDKSAYSGLTDNFDRRFNDHLKSGPVNKHMTQTNLVPDFFIVNYYIDCEKSITLEMEIWDKLKDRGYNMIHPRPSGQLGGYKKSGYSYDECYEVAKQYKFRSEFMKQEQSFYAHCEKEWLDKWFPKRKPQPFKNDYSYSECKKRALSTKNRNEYKLKHTVHYQNTPQEWLDEWFGKSIFKSKKICCDGQIFNSISDAARQLPISKSALRKRTKSSNFPNYYLMD